MVAATAMTAQSEGGIDVTRGLPRNNANRHREAAIKLLAVGLRLARPTIDCCASPIRPSRQARLEHVVVTKKAGGVPHYVNPVDRHVEHRVPISATRAKTSGNLEPLGEVEARTFKIPVAVGNFACVGLRAGVDQRPVVRSIDSEDFSIVCSYRDREGAAFKEFARRVGHDEAVFTRRCAGDDQWLRRHAVCLNDPQHLVGDIEVSITHLTRRCCRKEGRVSKHLHAAAAG